MYKVDILNNLLKLYFVDMESVEGINMSFNDFNLSICKLTTSTVGWKNFFKEKRWNRRNVEHGLYKSDFDINTILE